MRKKRDTTTKNPRWKSGENAGRGRQRKRGGADGAVEYGPAAQPQGNFAANVCEQGGVVPRRTAKQRKRRKETPARSPYKLFKT